MSAESERVLVGESESEPFVTDRLLLVRQVHLDHGGAPLVLERPLLLRAGHRCWMDTARRALIVTQDGGVETSYACWFAAGPDSPR